MRICTLISPVIFKENAPKILCWILKISAKHFSRDISGNYFQKILKISSRVLYANFPSYFPKNTLTISSVNSLFLYHSLRYFSKNSSENPSRVLLPTSTVIVSRTIKKISGYPSEIFNHVCSRISGYVVQGLLYYFFCMVFSCSCLTA